MPRYPETQALIEQALRHVLSVQEKLLKRSDAPELTEVLLLLNGLAIERIGDLQKKGSFPTTSPNPSGSSGLFDIFTK